MLTQGQKIPTEIPQMKTVIASNLNTGIAKKQGDC